MKEDCCNLCGSTEATLYGAKTSKGEVSLCGRCCGIFATIYDGTRPEELQYWYLLRHYGKTLPHGRP